MPRLVALDEAETLSQPGQQPARLERREERVVARLGEHAFDDERVRDDGLRLRSRAWIRVQREHRRRQLLREQLPVALAIEAREVAVLTGNVVEEAAKELRVLALFPEERREIELLLEATLLRDHSHERQQVEHHRLLSGEEQRARAQEQILLGSGQRRPLLAVGREVDRRRVPDAEPLRLLVQAKRGRVTVEPGEAHELSRHAAYPRTRFLSRKPMLAGRSARRRMR